MQYTIRNISEPLDAKLRQIANKKGQSLNSLVLEMLSRAVGLKTKDKKTVHTDLDFLIGSWKKDTAVEEALAAQNQIEKSEWE